MRANVSTLQELEEWEGVRDGAKVVEIEGGAHPDPSKEKENEVCGSKAKTPQNGKRKVGKERARREGEEGGSGADKRTRGAVGGVRRGGGGGRVSVQACRRESQLCGDRQMGILCLKTGENHLLGN